MTAHEQLLDAKGVRPTANRLLVLRALADSHHPLCLVDLEALLPTLERSSIFRALTTFRDHDVVHTIEDGGGAVRYELCTSALHHTLGDMHVHFYCDRCHETFCFEQLPVPSVALPAGFLPHATNYMVKGLCPRCARAVPADDLHNHHSHPTQ